jgi:hypothetical protein
VLPTLKLVRVLLEMCDNGVHFPAARFIASVKRQVLSGDDTTPVTFTFTPRIPPDVHATEATLDKNPLQIARDDTTPRSVFHDGNSDDEGGDEGQLLEAYPRDVQGTIMLRSPTPIEDCEMLSVCSLSSAAHSTAHSSTVYYSARQPNP